MVGQSICLLVAVILQVISAETPLNVLNPLHRECYRPPHNVERPHECCKLTSFYKEEDFKECGFDKIEEGEKSGYRHGPPDCTKSNCLLAKNDMLKDDKPDLEKIKAYITNWADKNPAFKDAVDDAITKCIKEDLPGPPHACLASKLAGCLTFRLFLKCPAENWESSANCDSVKEHIEKCKSLFENPPQ
ncbi:hypothetical protein K1T71_001132 [Dendrolimus kikuchii]|uniref:Uncharacterized protein n=1 Tax=Dendrolimus kikuchii TaxID=765133 RepID=A0ACC1DH21_9NEOP|nr:hypothetical protein K1T71_001132 [Dendrolimus kikuchii]